MKKFFILPVLLLVTLLSCEKKEPEVIIIKNSDKKISAISTTINNIVYNGLIDEGAKTVSFEIPFYFKDLVENMSFEYSFTGETLLPALNVAADFTQPQTVIITAEDGSKVEYTLTVNVLPEYDLTTFDKSTYSASDSVRIAGTNLGEGSGIVTAILSDLSSINPFSGQFSITYLIILKIYS